MDEFGTSTLLQKACLPFVHIHIIKEKVHEQTCFKTSHNLLHSGITYFNSPM